MRPVIFLVYAGQMRWRTKTGDEMEAHLGQDNTKDITAQAWRTALDPRASGSPRCCGRPTAGSPRCASRFRMPAAS